MASTGNFDAYALKAHDLSPALISASTACEEGRQWSKYQRDIFEAVAGRTDNDE